MTMPKASINENNRPERRKNNIRMPGKMFVMEAVTKTPPVKGTTYQKLWLGVLASDTGHHPATCASINNVSH